MKYKNVLKVKKNPGHKNFIPVNQLSLEHFPPGYHDNDVYDLTKVLADLTVRIAVKLTSPYRPEFVPGTKDPYPCYNTRGENSLRTGTGRVGEVNKYTKGMDQTYRTYRTCPCPECDHSDTPSKVWWEVDVVTARHVVFDESEARQSSCRLWFNDDKSPVVKIYGWEAVAYTEEEVNLLLIGKTGNGKSKTGNMILGRDEFPADSSFVDSPGVGDTAAIDDVEQVTELVINSMKTAILLTPQGYHAFLLVVRYGARFTKEDFECIRLLKNIFGEDFVKQFCVLVMTHDNLTEQRSITENLVNEIKKLREYLVAQDNETGALADLIRNIDQMHAMFKDRINSISELLEANYKLQKEEKMHQEQQETLNKILNKMLKEQKLEQQKLFEERKKMENETKKKEAEIKKQLQEE
ncbi:GTPase IMAP family member 9-like [Physella acuta]|uniref:GTPase IMAP family member 9-like n=1 Tax=Physella acuta TaxID=109671 RepID=UPI0027DB18AE|nr:GTPase IMAP family member 9-like [Physella acuta]